MTFELTIKVVNVADNDNLRVLPELYDSRLIQIKLYAAGNFLSVRLVVVFDFVIFHNFLLS